MQFLFDEKNARVSWDDIHRSRHTLAHTALHLQEVAAKGIYDTPESCINVAFDAALTKHIEEVAKKFDRKKLRYIFLIGIGGSNLGTKAVYDALIGSTDHLYSDRSPKMIFLDTVDPSFAHALITFIDREIHAPEEILVNIVSKSGTTAESIANFEFVYAALTRTLPRVSERIVATTDEGSPLWKQAEAKHIACLPIPHPVGGRFSVLSPVGLFPLLITGVDIYALLGGAEAMRSRSLATDIVDNPAMLSAAVIYEHMRSGYHTYNSFFFVPELESLGKWYRQLFAESIGKEYDREGKEVRTGLLPTVSIGSTDLHSVAQLYLGGPRDAYTSFIAVKNAPGGPGVPQETYFPSLVEHIEGKPFQAIMEAILHGVKTAYTSNGLPFTEIVLPDVSPHALGAYLQYKMMETIYLGELLHINVFDQPNVESYKVETRKRLTE